MLETWVRSKIKVLIQLLIKVLLIQFMYNIIIKCGENSEDNIKKSL